MPISSTDIQKLYVAFFNRPADPAGLGFWTVQGDIGAVARTMIGSAEFIAAHAGMSNEAIIGTFYQNLFGRGPDAEGLAFWRGAMDRGVLDAAGVASLMMRVTEGSDGATLANKTSLAASFTAALDTQAEQAIYATNPAAPTVKALMNSVDADSASLVGAQNQIDSTIAALFPMTPGPVVPAPPPATFTLTTANDAFTGTSIDNTFIGQADGVGATYNPGDVLNGGDGIDTLALTSTGSFTLHGANLTSIERLQVTAAGAEVLFVGVSGITELINEASTSEMDFGGLSAVNAVQQLANLTINGGTGVTQVFYGNAALAGNADDMKVSLNNTGANQRVVVLRNATANANELESVSFTVSGTNNTLLQTNEGQTSLATVNITGSGSLALNFANGSVRDSVTAINADTATADIILGTSSASLANASMKITLGSGNDVLHMGAKLTSANTLSGGAGTNTLVVSKAIGAGDLSNVKEFQNLRFALSASPVTQDASLADLSGLRYQYEGLGTLTLQNLTSNATVDVHGSTGTLIQTLAIPGGAGILNLNLSASASLDTLGEVAGLQTLTIVSFGTASVIKNDNVTAKHVITGDSNLTIESALKATVVDASNFDGNLNIKAGSGGSTITGGRGNDTITAGTAFDNISGGEGNDTIFLGVQGSNQTGGADQITLGAGNDTVVFVGNNAAGDGAAANYDAFVKITDFAVGTDLLRFSASDTDFSLAGHTGLAKHNVANGLNPNDAMVLQHIISGGAGAALSNASFFKLTTAVAPAGDIKTTFVAAFGSGHITDLAVNGNYLISIYDSTAAKMVIGVVNVGGDAILDSSDFTDSGIAVVGVVDMTALNYNAFNGTQLAIAI